MRERENPEVIAYLEAENEYTAAAMAHTEELEATLFQEIKDRIKPDDSSVPYRDGGYFYYTRYEEGMEYPVYARKAESTDAPEEIMLDANVLAEGHEYFAMGGRQVTEDGKILAYAVDTQGRRFYTVHFKDLGTGEILSELIPDVTGNMAWANDYRTLFYVKQDPQTLRSYRVFRHALGTDPSSDELVFEEMDTEFDIRIWKSKPDEYLCLASSQTLSTEFRVLDADDPTGEFRVVLPREPEHEYDIDHLGDHFYILTNDQAKNFRLVRAPVADPSRANWEEVIPHRDDVLLESFDVFRDYLVLSERSNALTTSEYDEWGDPREKEYFDYMLSYSPYDQVEAKDYPNILVTTGLADSQVQYWEPAKWVAKLRAVKTDDNLILLKTNMDAGHGGVSGRFRRYEESALQYAFMLDLAGLG